MSAPEHSERPTTRMGQHEVEQSKTAWTQLKESLFCCCIGGDGGNFSHVGDREQRGPPPSRMVSNRSAPRGPRRQSDYELTEGVNHAAPTAYAENFSPGHGRDHVPADPQHLTLGTASPTARLVPHEPEQKLQNTLRSTGFAATSPAEQWRKIHEEQREEQAHSEEHLAKVREAQGQLSGASNTNTGAPACSKEQSSSRELSGRSTGLRFEDRDQQRFDDPRGTPTPPPRASSNTIPGGDLRALPSVRRRLEAQRQNEETGSTEAYQTAEQLSIGQTPGASEAVSRSNSRRLPTPQTSPRPASEYVSPSQIGSSPASAMEQVRKATH